MNIKSTSSLRYWIKTQKARDFDKNTDPDFIGSYYQNKSMFRKGFFTVLHGLKEDIPGYLPSILKIAEDGQAIYEFIQNAVDCDSTHFWIYYDEENFIAINNGHPFKQNEIASILNIAQSDKRNLANEERCDKIGRFGIGFKLVHRLVGENDGTTELTKLENGTYKGPIIFSWSHYNQLRDFIGNLDSINQVKFDPENKNVYNHAPWLFKILLTNFPAAPGEIVKDLSYRSFTAFPIEEMKEMSSFLHQKLGEQIKNSNIFSWGTAFYLKLGKNKFTRLKEENKELENGVQYGLNILKKLQKVTINDTVVTRKPLDFRHFEIEQNSEEYETIQPEYNFCPIKISFGYHRKIEDIISLKSAPNFFKYFPLGDEVDQLAFIIHSDAFDIEANRRKLHKSERNIALLEAIRNRLLNELQIFCKVDKTEYLPLFITILLSEVSYDDKVKWITDVFTRPLYKFIEGKVPTVSNRLLAKEDVVVKGFNYDINLSDIGIPQKDWFRWSTETDSILIENATDKEKLGLEKWYLRNLVVKAETGKLENYLTSINIENYTDFISELASEDFTNELRLKLAGAKWIRTNKNRLVSVSEVKSGNIWLDKEMDADLQRIFIALGKEIVAPCLKNLKSFINWVDPLCFTVPQKIYDGLTQDQTRSLFCSLSIDDRYRLIGYLNEFAEMRSQIANFPFIKNQFSELVAPINLVNCENIVLTDAFRAILPTPDEISLIGKYSLNSYLIKEANLSSRIHSDQPFANLIKEHITIDHLDRFYKSLIEIHKVRDTKITDNVLFGLFSAFINEDNELDWLYNSTVLYFSSLHNLTNSDYSDFESILASYGKSRIPHHTSLQYLKHIGRLDSKETLGSLIKKTVDIPTTVVENFIMFFHKLEKGKAFNELWFSHDGANTLVFEYETGVYNYLKTNEQDEELVIQDIAFIPFSSTLSKQILINQGLLQKSDFGSILVKYANKLSASDHAFILNNDILTKLNYVRKLEVLNFSVDKTYSEEDAEVQVIYVAEELAKYASKNKDVEEHKQVVSQINEELSKLRSRIVVSDKKVKELNYHTEIKLKEPESIKEYKFLIEDLGIGDKNNLVIFRQFRESLSVLDDATFNRVFRPHSWDIRREVYEGILGSNTSLNPYQGVFIIIYESLNKSNSATSRLPQFSSLSEEDKINLFNYVFHIDRRTTIPLKKWPTIKDEIKFDFLIPEPDLAIHSEVPPAWLLSWMANDVEKLKFLEDAGFWGPDPNIVPLRKSIQNGSYGSENSLLLIDGSTDYSRLYWTVQWMGELNVFPSTADQKVFAKRLIDKAYGHYSKLSECPFVIIKGSSDSSYRWEPADAGVPIYRIDNVNKDYQQSVVRYLAGKGFYWVDNMMNPVHDSKLNIIDKQPVLERNVAYLEANGKELSDPMELEWQTANNLSIKELPAKGALYELKFDTEIIGEQFDQSAFKHEEVIYFVRLADAPLVMTIEQYLTAFQREDFYKRLYGPDKKDKDKKRGTELEERYAATFEKAIKDRLDLSKEDQMKINESAVEIGCGYLLENGYSLPNEGEFISRFSLRLLNKEGKSESFVFSSAVNGLLFMAPLKLQAMYQNHYSLIVIYPGTEIKRFNSVLDLITHEDNKFLLLRTQNSQDINQFMSVVNERLDDNAHFIFATSATMKKSLFSIQTERAGKKPIENIVTQPDEFEYDPGQAH